jgi:drug/metabolite transporter (DMT)-like permease
MRAAWRLDSFCSSSRRSVLRRAAGRASAELAGNGYFYAAFALYCTLSILWVWILTFTPLSRAYPFVALAFAVAPLLGAWVFGEPINLRLALGITAILCGLFLVAG